eukprot:349655-Chlamydomonas_euryale.AAC.8
MSEGVEKAKAVCIDHCNSKKQTALMVACKHGRAGSACACGRVMASLAHGHSLPASHVPFLVSLTTYMLALTNPLLGVVGVVLGS